jgi:hypothetical protein
VLLHPAHVLRAKPARAQMAAVEYCPRQYATTGGLAEVDFRSMAKSHDKSAIPNRDPTHPSGGKRKRGDEEARAAAPRGGRRAS